ncbi:MAG: hypothetical protein K2M31_05325 [Muribaculaceae bacterium]|nr:hypothetical protein [Muribaculaceae bacterium]
MLLRNNIDDNEEEDYFNTPHQEPKPKEPKPKEPGPDEPQYYDGEDEWEHLRPARNSWKLWGGLIILGVLLGLGYALWLRYFSPYEEEVIQYGYIERTSKRGFIFKTIEGVFLPYKALNDTVEPYPGDLLITAKNDHVAAELKKLEFGNLPARIVLERYRATVPWRGESVWVVVEADTADVTKIYPAPDRHPLIPLTR